MKKKLFISCPMKGRTEENIRKSMAKMHKLAEIVFDQELDVIPSYIEDNPPKDSNAAVYFLGRSLQLLSQADYYIGVDTFNFTGCDIENQVARRYRIPSFKVNLSIAAPDIQEKMDLREALDNSARGLVFED